MSYRTVTAADIVNRATLLLGVRPSGQALRAHEASSALISLNDMLNAWSVDNLLIYARQQRTFTLTGAASYSVGVGQDFDIERPVDLDRASPGYVTLDGTDYPLRLVPRNEFDQAAQKYTSVGKPSGLVYDAGVPYGNITLYPVIASGTLTLNYIAPLQVFETLAEEIALPPGYARALVYNLAVEISPEYPDIPMPQSVERTAMMSLAALKRKNSAKLKQSLNTGWTHGIQSDAYGAGIDYIYRGVS